MLLYCPICNKSLKERGEQITGGLYSIACFDCGTFDIEVDLSEILRRKYLSFNIDTVMGKESYEENTKIFQDFIRNHHHAVLTQTAVNEMVFLRRP